MRQFLHRQFATRTEKLNADQLSLELFNEDEDEDEADNADAIEETEAARIDVPAHTNNGKSLLS